MDRQQREGHLPVTLGRWTNAPSTLFHNLRLILVDENNRIVGLGERLPAGLPPLFKNLPISPNQQWTAFVNLSYGSHTVSPYIVTDDRKALIPLPAKMNL